MYVILTSNIEVFSIHCASSTLINYFFFLCTVYIYVTLNNTCIIINEANLVYNSVSVWLYVYCSLIAEVCFLS